jgi:hypothetical protein
VGVRMPLLSKVSVVFKFIFIFLIYLIIFFSLKIMYKDLKKGKVTSKKQSKTYEFALEVLKVSKDNMTLKVGSIIPLRDNFFVGRDEKNSLQLNDTFVSKKHAKIYWDKNCFIIKDLNSTNGVIINDEVIDCEMCLEIGDKIQIGSNVLKVIG